MSEQQVGRVRFEDTGDRLVCRAPASKSLLLVFYAVWLLGWTFIGQLFVRASLHTFHRGAHIPWFGLLWGVGWLFGIAFALWAILWSLGGVETLSVNAQAVELSSTLFGIQIRSRSTPLGEVRNLRYRPYIFRGRRNQQSSGLFYDDARGTAGFGKGITEAEGAAILENMLRRYAFPKPSDAFQYFAPR